MKHKAVIFMGLGMASLIAALWAGLIRLGWMLPPISVPIVAGHGPLMVSGFLGTVIGLERAVALGRIWPFAGPLCSGIGAVALIAGQSRVAALLFIVASLVLLADYLYIHRFQPTDFTRVMGIGAALWAIGNVIWAMSSPVWIAVPWWVGFLVFTIAGERLELSRMRGQLSAAQQAAFSAALIISIAGMALSASAYSAGIRLMGIGLLGLAAWLGRYDVARFTVRQRGLVRYIAVSILSGYGWLAASGALFIGYSGATFGYFYDAQLHAVFLGFVMSMVMAHAPIILPAVTGLRLRFSPLFYLPLGLLHAALVLRIASDLAAWMPGRMWGGLLNEVAVILFLLATARAARASAIKEPTAAFPHGV